MKKIFSLILITVAVAACGKKEAGDRATQLADLRKQQTDLTTKIAALEKELGKSDTTKKEKIKFISTTNLTPSVFTHFIELQGAVVADEEVYINARAAGEVTKVYIKIGDHVRANQVVAELNDDMIITQLDEVKKRLELATDVFQKQESLWKQNIGSEVAYLSAKNNKEALEKSIASIQKGREFYQIKSPISGVVDEVQVKVGSVAAPGVPLAKVVNFSKLKVKVDAPETYAGKVRAGNSVTVAFPDLNKEITSKISYIGAGVNPLSRTFKVEIPIRSNEANVLPNMASVVKVIDYSNGNAFVVPINLIQKDLAGSDFVILENGGRAQKAVVKVGQMYGDKAEILSGLKSGNKLITVGYQELNEGDKVQVQ